MTNENEKSLRELHRHLIDDLDFGEHLNADHSQLLTHQLHTANNHLTVVYNSISWRLTSPLRKANARIMSLGIPTNRVRYLIGAFRQSLRTEGFVASVAKAKRFVTKQKIADFSPAFAGRDTKEEEHAPANEVFKKSIALICEATIPQCFKYRVLQKADMLRILGISAHIVDWRDSNGSMSALQTCSAAIFYRVPFVESVQNLFEEAKRLNVPTFWEVDDLIFDIDLYKSNKNIKSLSPELAKSVLDGAILYGDCLKASNFGIASTEKLRDVMSKDVPAAVLENALDKQTTEIARGLRREKKLFKSRTKSTVDIMYGSGTKSHDIDFLEAEAAILSVLRKRPNARFIVMGDLTVSDELERSKQFLRLPFADFKNYLRKLSMADISIAPLDHSEFNEAKSNIKFLEASVLNLPSVCTPTTPFAEAIEHGVNGYLANSTKEWEASLLELIDDSEKREAVAKNAFVFVYKNYSPSRIARRQLLPIIQPVLEKKPRKRVLSVNIFFSPYSFGGATIVAEQMVSHLSGGDVDHYVFTVDTNLPGADYLMHRHKTHGAEVIAIKTPAHRSQINALYDERIRAVFMDLLKSIDPDVVHFHSIQELGLSMLEACRLQDIPYIVTVHDTWWLCGRQFMVNDRNEFCGQRKIDPLICSVCVGDAKFDAYRRAMCHAALKGAKKILAPSEYIRKLYIDNGFSPDQIVTNKNGVKTPEQLIVTRIRRPLTFGYVGGRTEIKGWDVVVKAFNELSGENIRLSVVDNALNLGVRTIDDSEFDVSEKVTIVPAYNQNTIDEFFASIDVLLFPTQAMESFGLTVREALIRGKWVISTDAGGVVEDIIDGVNGTVIPMTKDHAFLVNAMKAILDDGKIRDLPVGNKANIRTFGEQANELQRHYNDAMAS